MSDDILDKAGVLVQQIQVLLEVFAFLELKLGKHTIDRGDL